MGYIVQKQLLSRNLKATTIGRKSIRLEDISNGSSDALDFTERIINFALGYGHLIVATSNQIHIYNEKYINTPIIIDGRTDVRVIEVGKKYNLVHIFSIENYFEFCLDFLWYWTPLLFGFILTLAAYT